MTDLIGGVRQAIQDIVAPDMRAMEARQDAMSRLMEVQHNALMTNMDAFRAEMRSEFAALRAANRLEVYRQLAPLSERIAVLEKRG